MLWEIILSIWSRQIIEAIITNTSESSLSLEYTLQLTLTSQKDFRMQLKVLIELCLSVLEKLKVIPLTTIITTVETSQVTISNELISISKVALWTHRVSYHSDNLKLHWL